MISNSFPNELRRERRGGGREEEGGERVPLNLRLKKKERIIYFSILESFKGIAKLSIRVKRMSAIWVFLKNF
jgi:hypothetical protein